MPDLSNAVSQFTYSDEQKNREESLRRQFLERFPASGLGDLTLEQYSLGLEPMENSFCYWLEFKTKELGSIAGGAAFKFVIFFDREGGQYRFASKYKSKEEAFSTVKSGILELMRLGAEGKFAECENVSPYETMTITRGKILNMYFPEQFLAVFSPDHLKDFCLQLEVPADYDSQTAMNLALLKFKQEHPLFGGWTNDKFASFLYEKLPPTVQFWKIAPGENARLWQQCHEGGFICVGWGEIGDMRQYVDLADFKDKYRELHGSNRQCKEMWSFAKELKKGHIIIANNGLQSIVGVGTVTGDYYYDDSRAEYKHCVPVQWDITTAFPVPESARNITATWFQGTVKRISRQEYSQLVSGQQAGSTNSPKQPINTETDEIATSISRYTEICAATFLDETFFEDCERLLKTKKQIIMQGAPGTGKTFVAEQLATLWAGDPSRVKVVQFHESYGYEDFVHGIKPRVGADGKTAFTAEPGLFLKFCEAVRQDKANQYVLLIDEINRAKTARVFGELLFLLEYRNKIVELQCGESFSIPQNLYIIGTMNTTDKSIALVDYALRRRFAFIDLVPVKNGQSSVLGKWMDAKEIGNAADVEQLYVALNNAVAQKDEALLVGHSYFMQQQAINEKWFSAELLRFIWDYYIMPLIAEYEYQMSRAELEKKYGLAALRAVAN
jgi:5-methylcytosine-specific restriction protein B